jgi:hypothetical protein
LGFGVDCIDQPVPFQAAANAPARPWPTAVQAVADEHDTPSSWPAPVLGFGVVWIDQVVPFQRSANVPWPPPGSEWSPTAVQAVADVHDTPLSWLADAVAGLALGWRSQAAPFHRSTSVTRRPAVSK